MKTGNMRILDLGCGLRKRPGAYGVDHRALPGVDLVHDLNQFPYPIEDNSYDLIIASHIVEHLDDVPAFFEQMARIGRDGAEIEIITPHFSNRSAFADPTHRRFLSVRFLDFFCGSDPRVINTYSKVTQTVFEHRFEFEPYRQPPAFKMKSLELTFSRIFHWIGVAAFANRWPDFYEFYLAFAFPARDIVAGLTVLKGGE